MTFLRVRERSPGIPASASNLELTHGHCPSVRRIAAFRFPGHAILDAPGRHRHDCR
jgi:hypothetical protein